MSSKLNKRHSLFLDEYCIDLNGTRAAIAVGCTKKSAPVQASKWLKNPKIAAELAKRLAKRAQKCEVSAEKVLEGLTNLAFFDIRKLYNEDGSLKKITELDDQTAAAICGIEEEIAYTHFGGGNAKPSGTLKKVKLADRGLNLERIGRYFKMFTDKLEVTGLEGLADALAKARRRRGGK